MRIQSLLVAAALSLAAATPSAAATFDFTYTFDTGDVVSGSFTGVQSGDLITGISNVSMELNGQALPGDPNMVVSSCTDAGAKCGGCWTSGGAVVSTDPLKNNFYFSDQAANDNNIDWFYMVPWPNGGNNTEAVQALSPSGSLIDSYNGDLIQANWSVAEVPAGAVPEPATWAMLILGLGLIGGALRVRRGSVALA